MIMARMDEKRRRRQFRFGLLTLFVVIALSGIVVSMWNPFDPRLNRSKLNLVKPGMTVAQVAALVGEPDQVTTNASMSRIIQRYRLNSRDSWWIYYANGQVRESNHQSRLAVDQ